jgi:hypothetical protein
MVYVGVCSPVGTVVALRYLSIFGVCRGWLSSRNSGDVKISKYFMVYDSLTSVQTEFLVAGLIYGTQSIIRGTDHFC